MSAFCGHTGEWERRSARSGPYSRQASGESRGSLPTFGSRRGFLGFVFGTASSAVLIAVFEPTLYELRRDEAVDKIVAGFG